MKSLCYSIPVKHTYDNSHVHSSLSVFLSRKACDWNRPFHMCVVMLSSLRAIQLSAKMLLHSAWNNNSFWPNANMVSRIIDENMMKYVQSWSVVFEVKLSTRDRAHHLSVRLRTDYCGGARDVTLTPLPNHAAVSFQCTGGKRKLFSFGFADKEPERDFCAPQR